MSEPSEMSEAAVPETIERVAEIVCAYVSNNAVAVGDLPGLISAVHGTLLQLGKPSRPSADQLVPAVPVKKSVTPDYLFSLEDGRRYKSLKRHLSGRGLTPDQYREKWGLARDYPMVAPNYAKQRSELAKALGLGRKPAPAPEPVPVKPARGSRRKAA